MGFYDSIDWYFMTVGHKKFRPDEGFGHIRKIVGNRVDVSSMDELRDATRQSSFGNE